MDDGCFAAHYPSCRVDLQVAYRQRSTDRDGEPFDPSKYRSNSRNQFPRTKWLGHVVIRPNPKTHQHVRFGIPGGQHQNWDGPVLLDPSAHLKSIETRKHDVEDDQVRADSGAKVYSSLRRRAAIAADIIGSSSITTWRFC